MCHFVTATLPRKVELGLVAPIFESHKLGFKLIANRHIAEQIEAGNSYILNCHGSDLSAGGYRHEVGRKVLTAEL
jgi:hypothetical protein